MEAREAIDDSHAVTLRQICATLVSRKLTVYRDVTWKRAINYLRRSNTKNAYYFANYVD